MLCSAQDSLASSTGSTDRGALTTRPDLNRQNKKMHFEHCNNDDIESLLTSITRGVPTSGSEDPFSRGLDSALRIPEPPIGVLPCSPAALASARTGEFSPAALLRVLGDDHLLCALQPDKRGLIAYRGSVDEALERAARMNAAGYNIYYQLNRVRPGMCAKARKEDITHIIGLPTDRDWDWKLNPGRYQERVAELEAEQRRFLTGNMPPSTVVFTGGGYQEIFCFGELLPHTPEVARRMEALSRELVQTRGGDMVGNPDRILRLPGFKNFPKAQKANAGQPVQTARIEAVSNVRYTLEELEAKILRRSTSVACSGSDLGPIPAFLRDIRFTDEFSLGIERRPLDIEHLKSAVQAIPGIGGYTTTDGTLVEYDLSKREHWLTCVVFPAAYGIVDHSEHEAELRRCYHQVCAAGLTCAYGPGELIWDENDRKLDDEVSRIQRGSLPDHHPTVNRWFSMASQAGWTAKSETDPVAPDGGGSAPATAAQMPNNHFGDFGSFGTGENTWPELDMTLLGSGRRHAPVFPTDILGPFWSAWTVKAAQGASAPVDYASTALLACAGAAIANVRWGHAGANWSEPPLIWAALVGSPSAGKSPGMDTALRLIQHIEDQQAANFDTTLRAYETQKQFAAAKRDAWQAQVKTVAKNGGTPPNMPADAEEPLPPVRPRIRVADSTQEKLGALAAALPRGLLQVRDELAGWFGSFDRYGGGGADRAFAIEMYGGRSYTVDRMKHPEPLRIRHLSIGVLGGIQPDKISEILNTPDDGFISRMLWSWPEALPKFKLARTLNDDIAAQKAFARLGELATGIGSSGNPEPTRVKLSPQAENELEDFGQRMADRAQAVQGMMAGTLGKARGHALRLATVLEFLWWCAATSTAEPKSISEQAVRSAVVLLDQYYHPMAARVFGDASIPASEQQAMALAKHIHAKGLRSFNARNLRREIGRPLQSAKHMDEACTVLVETGWIRPKKRPHGPGRPASDFAVNPAVLAPQAKAA